MYADLTNEYDFVSAAGSDLPSVAGRRNDFSQYNGQLQLHQPGQRPFRFFLPRNLTAGYHWCQRLTNGVNIQSTDDTMVPALDLFNAGGVCHQRPDWGVRFNVYLAQDTTTSLLVRQPWSLADADIVCCWPKSRQTETSTVCSTCRFPEWRPVGSQSTTAVPFSSNDMDILDANPAPKLRRHSDHR